MLFLVSSMYFLSKSLVCTSCPNITALIFINEDPVHLLLKKKKKLLLIGEVSNKTESNINRCKMGYNFSSNALTQSYLASTSTQKGKALALSW